MFFTRSQQRAFIIVAVVSAASFAIRFTWQNQPIHHDFSEFHARFVTRLDSIRQAEKQDSIRQAKQAKTNVKKHSKSTVIINPNTASAAELQQLPGIGKKMAARIMAYRREHGPFRKPEALLKVKGIGKKSLKKIRAQLKFGER